MVMAVGLLFFLDAVGHVKLPMGLSIRALSALSKLNTGILWFVEKKEIVHISSSISFVLFVIIFKTSNTEYENIGSLRGALYFYYKKSYTIFQYLNISEKSMIYSISLQGLRAKYIIFWLQKKNKFIWFW